MRIAPFHRNDLPRFLALAHGEGWVAEEWEFDFLMKEFPEGCLSMADDKGEGIAFITALKHGTSGWLGNLIVAKEVRRRGHGEVLFRRALGLLRDSGAQTVWLTASATGKSLYERYGFRNIDTIVRWTGSGRRDVPASPDVAVPACTNEAILGIDRETWDDRRDALLEATVGRGILLQNTAGFVVVQPSGNNWQVGPFSATDHSTAGLLLEAALSVVPSGAKVCVDAPARNSEASHLFAHSGMQPSGINSLMYTGTAPAYRPELLYGLATMGSCG